MSFELLMPELCRSVPSNSKLKTQNSNLHSESRRRELNPHCLFTKETRDPSHSGRIKIVFLHCLHSSKPLAGVEPARASLQKKPVAATSRRLTQPLEGIEPSPAPYRGAVRSIDTGAAGKQF
jgi:hypothetical protein